LRTSCGHGVVGLGAKKSSPIGKSGEVDTGRVIGIGMEESVEYFAKSQTSIEPFEDRSGRGSVASWSLTIGIRVRERRAHFGLGCECAGGGILSQDDCTGGGRCVVRCSSYRVPRSIGMAVVSTEWQTACACQDVADVAAVVGDLTTADAEFDERTGFESGGWNCANWL
jgi:hypothetical protein